MLLIKFKEEFRIKQSYTSGDFINYLKTINDKHEINELINNLEDMNVMELFNIIKYFVFTSRSIFQIKKTKSTIKIKRW